MNPARLTPTAASASVVLSYRSSFAQQNEPEVERKVLSKVAPTYPALGPQGQHLWGREARSRNCVRR